MATYIFQVTYSLELIRTVEVEAADEQAAHQEVERVTLQDGYGLDRICHEAPEPWTLGEENVTFNLKKES